MGCISELLLFNFALACLSISACFPGYKGTDVGRANKHGIFIASNLYIVAVDFSSLSAQCGVCFILKKERWASKDFTGLDCIY